jgi:hypothetical protein
MFMKLDLKDVSSSDSAPFEALQVFRDELLLTPRVNRPVLIIFRRLSMAYGQNPRDRETRSFNKDQINEPNLSTQPTNFSFGYILGALALAALLIIALSYGRSTNDVDTTATTAQRSGNAPVVTPQNQVNPSQTNPALRRAPENPY